MPKQYEVVIKLMEWKSPCHFGHKIGDEFIFDYSTPPRLCGLAFNAMYPLALSLLYGHNFPWQKEAGVTTVCCPDADAQCIFELRLREKKPAKSLKRKKNNG